MMPAATIISRPSRLGDRLPAEAHRTGKQPATKADPTGNEGATNRQPTVVTIREYRGQSLPGSDNSDIAEEATGPPRRASAPQRFPQALPSCICCRRLVG